MKRLKNQIKRKAKINSMTPIVQVAMMTLIKRNKINKLKKK
jgi:hypothetical protein